MSEDSTHSSDPSPTRRLGWRALLRTQEAGILLISVLCQVGILAWFFVLSVKDSGRAAQVFAVVASHLTAGRAAGITTSLGYHFTRWEAIGLATLTDGAIVCLFFPVFSLSFRRLITFPFLHSAMATVERTAVGQRTRIRRWGIPGLMAFVWFPFHATGPVVGSVIGLLLGMRPWVVITVVLGGTVLAIVSWTMAMGPLVEKLQDSVGEFLPLMAVLIILVFAGSYHLNRYLGVQKRRRNGSPPAGGPDSTQPGAGDV